MGSTFDDLHGAGDEIFLFGGSPATGFGSADGSPAFAGSEMPELYLNLIDNPFDLIASPSSGSGEGNGGGNFFSPSTVSPDSGEDHEVFSDLVFSYINDMLMEDNIDEKLDGYLDASSALEATEKSLHEALGGVSPQPLAVADESIDNLYGYPNSGASNIAAAPIFSSESSFGSSSNGGGAAINPVESLEESLLSSNWVPDLSADTEFARQFRRGVEDARKFLPSDDQLIINVGSVRNLTSGNGLPSSSSSSSPAAAGAKNGGNITSIDAEDDERGGRGRKNPYDGDRFSDDPEEDQRSSKHSATFSDEPVRSDMFDRVLLFNEHSCMSQKQKTEVKEEEDEAQSKGLSGKAAHSGRKSQSKKGDVVDVRTLLIHCAQAVSSDDRRSAVELLKQIRRHGSELGDGSQRLAHYFADGLEARLAGTGSQVYRSKVLKRLSAAELLKAYQLFLSACPFKRAMHFFANRTIIELAENASRLHIVDFGIHYGFQWPSFMQFISERPGGPPRLRITGIEVPRPGFRPEEMVEETGRRLADYAKSFRIPFEYNAIAANWETISVDDIKVEEDEMLVVNCMYRLHTVAEEIPRDTVLDTMRRLNPDLFVTSVVNGGFSAPFFVTRFREALFHFATLFDMLDTNVSRENPERLCIERELLGRDIVNVVACEGAERVERPETYKQWQARIRRAGFGMQPLNQEMLKQAKCKMRSMYHKDFVLEEDCEWLLLGWKGRIVYGLSFWKPGC